MDDMQNGAGGMDGAEEPTTEETPGGGMTPAPDAAPASGDMTGTPHPDEDASEDDHKKWHDENPEAPAHDEEAAEGSDDQPMAA